MEKVIQPKFRIIYDGTDITTDITPFILSINYTDAVDNESDQLSISVDDTQKQWRGLWLPEKGSTLDLSIGLDDVLFPCGVFEIDEIEFSGPPDVVSIRAMATPSFSKTLRTKKSRAHENKTLLQIIERIATENGLSVSGEFDSNPLLERTTQNHETDLSFLRRIATDYGYLFSIRSNDLIFTSILLIEGLTAVGEVSRGQLSSYSIIDKASKTYKGATVKHRNPQTGKLIEGAATASGSGVSGDQLEIITKAENGGQAGRKAEMALHEANTRQQNGTISLFGNPRLLAGNNFDLIRMGALSGVYNITNSTHNLTPSAGYTTTATIKKVGEIDKTRW